MKKFLLASVCLLALTACSQGQQGKGTTAASSKQEATQTKKEQVQTKTFVSDLGDRSVEQGISLELLNLVSSIQLVLKCILNC